MFERIATSAFQYDAGEVPKCEEAARYLILYRRSHKQYFMKYLFINLLSLIINVLIMVGFNSMLLGRFITYGYQAFPFSREMDGFTDTMSTTFPPFAQCLIDQGKELLNERMDNYGCQLTGNEFYEKIFLVMWYWLTILFFMTVCYLAFLFCFFVPMIRPWIVRVSKPFVIGEQSISETLHRATEKFDIGDWFVLYKMRALFSDAGFVYLLDLLANEVFIDAIRSPALNEIPKTYESSESCDSRTPSPPNKGYLIE